MNWLEFFGFTTDPFVTKPLQSESEFQDLLFKTKIIEGDIDTLPNQIFRTPFIKLVVGKRGLGKTTVLRYATHLCQKSGILSIYIGIHPHDVERVKAPVYEITRLIIRSILQEFIKLTYEIKQGFFTKYKNILIDLGKIVGLTFDEVEGFFKDPSIHPSFEYNTLKEGLITFLDLAYRNKIPMLVTIDNIDKLKQNIVWEFLKGTTSQPLFEKMNEVYCSVLIAIDDSLASKIEKNPNFTYLGQKVVLTRLSPLQIEQLLLKRIQKYSKNPESSNIFESDAVRIMYEQKDGITRDILNEARTLCIQAAERKIKVINSNFIRFIEEQVPTLIDESKLYLSVTQKEDIKSGIEKILEMASEIDDVTNFSRLLKDIYSGKQVDIPVHLANVLIEKNILFSPEGLISRYRLNRSIYELIKEVEKGGIDLPSFLAWLLNSDNLPIINVGTPLLKIKRLVNSVLDTIRELTVREDYVKITQGGAEVRYLSSNLKLDVIKKFTIIRSKIQDLDQINWEDLNNEQLLEMVYYALKNSLLSFTKLFLILERINVNIKSAEIDNWEFIIKTIAAYQRKKGVYFKTYRFIKNIKTNFFAMKKGIYSPSDTDTNNMLRSFEEVFSEMYKELKNLTEKMVQPIEVDSSLKHEAVKSIVSELAKRMLYDEVLDNYRTFRVDGEKYRKIGCFKERTNTAEIDIVQRRTDKQSDGKQRHIYFIAEVKTSRFPIDHKSLVCFLEKCYDLISLTEKEQERFPTFLKPKYYLFFISLAGFTDRAKENAKKMLNLYRRKGVEMIELLNRDELNNLLKKHNLRKI